MSFTGTQTWQQGLHALIFVWDTGRAHSHADLFVSENGIIISNEKDGVDEQNRVGWKSGQN